MYQKTILRNGIRVVTEQIPHVKSVSTGIWLNVGSRDEGGEERGLTHFIEHMLFKGTRRRSALDIAKELDAVGGFANAFTSKEHVCLHAKVLDSHLPLVVDVLTDIFLNSVFAPEEIEREQQVILQEIRMIEETPEDFVHILFQQMFWDDNPLAFPIYGSTETVTNTGRDDILHYLARTFLAPRIVIAAAGNLEHDQFVELVAPAMETWPQNNTILTRQTPQNRYTSQLINKDLEQVHLCLGTKGASHQDEQRFACHLINTILGGSMSSRLFQEIREKRGLAYSIYSFINSHEDIGLLGIYAAIAAENLQQTLELIQEQLGVLASQPIPAPELSAAKECLKGSMYLNAESTDARMNRLAKNEFLFGRYVAFEEVEAQIESVTTEQIRAWCREVFQPDQLALLVFGPASGAGDHSQLLLTRP